MPDKTGTLASVLVVDDEQYMCDVCARTLRRCGYDVVATTDPQVAVHLLKQQPFDLLISDIRMPTMSGMDLALIAREQDPAIAIIIMTGYTSMESLHQSLQRGVAEFLAKPFELEQLRTAVEDVLRRREAMRNNVRAQTLEQVLQTSEALNASLDVPTIAAILLDRAFARTRCQAALVLLTDESSGLYQALSQPNDVTATEQGFALAKQVISEQRTIVATVPGLQREQGTIDNIHAIQLRTQGRTNGILLIGYEQPTTMEPGAREEISLLANYAGSALHNAVLYRQLNDAYLRLQDMDRLKSEFIAVASHELRTPLAIVLGYTMMLRDQSTGSQHDYLQRVMDNAERIKEIVDDMVNLRYLDTGQTTLTLGTYSLRALIQGAVERQQPAAAERSHAVEVQLPADDIAFVCDSEKVLLVLSHLIANAIRFTPRGGAVTVCGNVLEREMLQAQRGYANAVELPLVQSISAESAWVIIEVHDTGIGVAESEQQNIFQRFYQVADSLTRDHGGIGLGLAIVRELVVVMGGRVWVDSREGEGSTFTLLLPYRQDEPVLAAVAQA